MTKNLRAIRLATAIRPEIFKPYDVRFYPAPAPSPGIFDAPTVKVCVNSQWVSHIDGVLERLLFSDAWRNDGERAISEIRKLLVAFSNIADCEGEPLDLSFKFEGCSLYVSFDGGVTWEEVPGWDTYAPTCFKGDPGEPGQDAQPFDLRFNNCNLEYSRDGAQTWDILPGWSDWLSCIPGGQSYDLRFRDGLLEYSKDGGQDWALVDGWETGIQQVVESKDRCLNAWGSAFGLKELTASFAGLMFQCATIEEYTTAFYAEWLVQFGNTVPVPQPMAGDFIELTWNVPDKGALYDAIGRDDNADQLAARIFTIAPNGEWCTSNLDAFLSYYPCENTPTWIAAVIKMTDCLFQGLDSSIRKARARMFAYRGLGTCQDCSTLVEIDPCGGAGRCHFFDFTTGTDNWYAYVGDWTANGFKTVLYQGDVRYMSVGINLSGYDASWGLMTARFVFANTNPEAELWIYAVTGGQTILLANKDMAQGGDTTVSIPADASQIICRGSCSVGDVYLESVMLDYTSGALIWSDNCGRG